ncbi:MAG TPA: hypothetical protein PLS24_00525 [Sedimentisphaerales bacterium]|nr:hypothetical protein [Sedimentisphaerales bacterium]
MPESVRALHAAAVQVEELMVRMTFLSEDGLQHYDDGLREVGEEYRDYLKSLEQETLSFFLNWQRKGMNLPLPRPR